MKIELIVDSNRHGIGAVIQLKFSNASADIVATNSETTYVSNMYAAPWIDAIYSHLNCKFLSNTNNSDNLQMNAAAAARFAWARSNVSM